MHLTHVYEKLEIAGRAELSGMLGDGIMSAGL
jgi:DNA-binding CsgD family transcriptional regulator